jgi:hypothetical protein
MKNSSPAGTPPPLDRPTAWACALTNALTLPGLGSVTAGRRAGYAQAATALAGFALTLWWLFRTIQHWLAAGELPTNVDLNLAVGLAGATLYVGAWFWALRTSRQLLREARANEAQRRAAEQVEADGR